MAQSNNKILVYFSTGIASPSLLLSYFAVRGIQNNRSLYGQQFLHKIQGIAPQITMRSKSFGRFETEFFSEGQISSRDYLHSLSHIVRGALVFNDSTGFPYYKKFV